MEADRSVVSPPLKDGGLIITGMLIPLIESPPISWVLTDRFWPIVACCQQIKAVGGGDQRSSCRSIFQAITQRDCLDTFPLGGIRQRSACVPYAVQLWRAWSLPLPAFIGAMLLLFGLVWAGLAILPWSNPIVQSTFILAISGA